MLNQIRTDLEELAGILAAIRPDLADRAALAADRLALSIAERAEEPRTDLGLLRALQRELGIDDLAAREWILAVAQSDFPAWLHQREPRDGFEVDYISQSAIDDALAWASGNPNQFGRARILATLWAYRLRWPLMWEPTTMESLRRHILFGQAASVAFGQAAGGRYAPLPGGRLVTYEHDRDWNVTTYSLDRNAHARFFDCTLWRAGWRDGATVRRHGPPSLEAAAAAFDELAGGGACGAGWIAGASR